MTGGGIAHGWDTHVSDVTSYLEGIGALCYGESHAMSPFVLGNGLFSSSFWNALSRAKGCVTLWSPRNYKRIIKF